MELGLGEEPSPMVVALLWPALGQRFPAEDGPGGNSTTLIEINGRFAAIEQPSAVIVSEADGALVTTYSPWT